MRKQGGLILNVSAPLGQAPLLPSLGAYAATKASLSVLSLTARAELAADNIRVGAFYPGMMAVAWEAGDALPPGAPQLEALAVVARQLLEAFQREDAEYYTEGFKQLAVWVNSMASAQP